MNQDDLVRETIDIIIRGFDPETIIIFGSVASGAADDHSDLDILVVMDTDESYYRRPLKVYKAVSKVCITKDILVLSSDEFYREDDNHFSFTHEIIRTG